MDKVFQNQKNLQLTLLFETLYLELVLELAHETCHMKLELELVSCYINLHLKSLLH